jgi:spore maturation protein A
VLNKVWFWLLLIGVLYGFGKGAWQSFAARGAAEVAAPVGEQAGNQANPAAPSTGITAMGKRLNAAVLDAAETSVTICIGLVGIMAVWLGLLNIAKDAGMVDALAHLLRPLMRWLFPEIPDGHPAQGAILMNLSANMLNLENAATPLGLKAMRELEELNPVKDTATDSMAMFLAINTSSITLIPFTIMGYRQLNGSENPAGFVGGTLIATVLSSLCAIAITRWMSRWPRFRMPPAEGPA